MKSSHSPKLGVFQYSRDPSMMVALHTPSDWSILANNLTQNWKHPGKRVKTNNGQTNTCKALRLIGDILEKGDNSTAT